MVTKKVRLELELPDELVAYFDSLEAVSQEAKEALVMDLLRQGKFSQGKAAELLGVSRWDLPKILAKHNIPAIMVDPEELEQDWQSYKHGVEKTA
jgi:predicted HTH domain antitoxin